MERVRSRQINPVLYTRLILWPNKLYFNHCGYLKVLKAWQEPRLRIQGVLWVSPQGPAARLRPRKAHLRNSSLTPRRILWGGLWHV